MKREKKDHKICFLQPNKRIKGASESKRFQLREENQKHSPAQTPDQEVDVPVAHMGSRNVQDAIGGLAAHGVAAL